MREDWSKLTITCSYTFITNLFLFLCWRAEVWELLTLSQFYTCGAADLAERVHEEVVTGSHHLRLTVLNEQLCSLLKQVSHRACEQLYLIQSPLLIPVRPRGCWSLTQLSQSQLSHTSLCLYRFLCSCFVFFVWFGFRDCTQKEKLQLKSTHTNRYIQNIKHVNTIP